MAGMISLSGGMKYRFMHLTIWVILHVFFPIVSSLIKTGEDTGNGFSLDKNLNMNGEFIVEGWKYGLIEVDLMPTLADEITPLLGM